MQIRKLGGAGVALVTATALSGCLGGGGGSGGGGGGGGGGGTPAGYQAAYDRASGKIPTNDMPTSGSASYAGQVQMAARDAGQVGSPEVGRVTGDIAMDVSFRAAGVTAGNNVTGSATNFVVEAGGQSQALAGTLTAGAGGLPATVSATSLGVISTPVGPVDAGTVGALNVAFRGELSGSVDGAPMTGDVILNIGGAFTGPGAESAFGPAGMLGVEDGGFADIVGQGTFYLNRR